MKSVWIWFKSSSIVNENPCLFDEKNINVIRIGLQNTEEISDPKNSKSEVVAGPYHPAFRQLVESCMWYDAIVSKIKKLNTNKPHIFQLFL